MALVSHILLISGLVDWHFISYCQIFQDSIFEASLEHDSVCLLEIGMA